MQGAGFPTTPCSPHVWDAQGIPHMVLQGFNHSKPSLPTCGTRKASLTWCCIARIELQGGPTTAHLDLPTCGTRKASPTWCCARTELQGVQPREVLCALERCTNGKGCLCNDELYEGLCATPPEVLCVMPTKVVCVLERCTSCR